MCNADMGAVREFRNEASTKVRRGGVLRALFLGAAKMVSCLAGQIAGLCHT